MFELGKTYEFKNGETTLEFTFIHDFGTFYQVKLVGGTHILVKTELYEIKNLYKTSRILKWKYKEIDTKTSGITPAVVEKAKRRSKEEIAMDNFLENCINKRRVEVLYDEINKALDNNDVDLFTKLTKEYAKLKKKVTV